MGAREVAMARRQVELDQNKLRAAIRKLPDEYVFYMLDEAIDQLPKANLHRIVKKYLDLRRLRPDRKKARKARLLEDVKAFERASLAGEYYESFDVNSRFSPRWKEHASPACSTSRTCCPLQPERLILRSTAGRRTTSPPASRVCLNPARCISLCMYVVHP
jgi:hypothetical protein